MRTNTGNTMTSNPISRDFQNVVDDAHELLKTVQAEGGTKMSEAHTKLQQSFDVARTKLAEASATAKETAKQAAAKTDEYVHEHPWQAIGAGAAVGILIGILIARR